MGTLGACCAMESIGWPDFHQEDKQLHFAGGLVIGGLTAGTLGLVRPQDPPWKRVLWGTIVAAAVGAAKEVYDHQHADEHDCDGKDAVATALGGLGGSLSVGVVVRW